MGFFDSRAVVVCLRIVQAVLSIVTVGLTAYVATWWQNYYHGTAPSQIAFVLFSAAWSIAALLYLVIVPFRFSESKANHEYTILAVEGLTMLFWLAGFVAEAVFVSDRVCFGHVCDAAKASAVLGALAWIFFAITTAMATVFVLRNRGGGNRGHSSTKNTTMAGV